jgi:hypothetical protein
MVRRGACRATPLRETTLQNRALQLVVGLVPIVYIVLCFLPAVSIADDPDSRFAGWNVAKRAGIWQQLKGLLSETLETHSDAARVWHFPTDPTKQTKILRIFPGMNDDL